MAGVTALLAVSGVWALSASKPSLVKAAPTQAARKPVSGAVTYSAEGWPIIEGKTIRLAGVGLIAPPERDRFARWITSHGGYLECDSSDGGSTYRCLTPQRLDVAQAILLNGAAQATSDADPQYRAAAEQARKSGRAPRY
ncbi:MAG: hypothetical protein JO227_15530 [Acetobacteraceae bacterium]|nr:hypothetical protein [Acetobacteraceae bacterium]